MVEIDEKQAFSIIQKAKETGSIRIGINEVTKNIERAQAKAVFFANDVSPAEIVAHIPGLCKEMNILCASIGTRAEIGSAVGIKNATAVAIIDGGSAKKEIEKLVADNKAALVKKTEKVEAKVEVKAEAKVEAKAEVKKEKKVETPAKKTKEAEAQ